MVRYLLIDAKPLKDLEVAEIIAEKLVVTS